ncbi:MAG: DNA polymerase III subunit delta' [Anaerolineae bacterium]|nr:DNA polymerase III subunit delta' [Anaerolineales bacterium]MCQ3974631.1 DNA polymerase III subunit delta' [Anaerolineae bacterium]
MSIQSDFKVYVVGHEWALDLLNRQQAAGRVPQALLLTGPPNVGKSTVARFWAQQLNCQQTPAPCGQCPSCRKIISGNHPDVRIFDSDDQALKIDDIRNLQRELSLSPNEGRYRVVVLANFERATLSAANALLKTLEEPASQAILVLTATDPGALLPTIVSRCQMLALRLLPHGLVVEALREHWRAEPEQAELLAQLAAGRLGWTVKALHDTELLSRREQHLQELISLLQAGRAERLAYAHQLSRDGAMLREVLTLWLTIWRDLLLLQSGAAQTKIMNLNWQERLQQLAGHSSLAEASQMVARLRTALINLERNVNPRLSLEVLLLKLPKLREV